MIETLRRFHNNPSRRPYWQIPLLVPVVLLAMAARRYLEMLGEY